MSVPWKWCVNHPTNSALQPTCTLTNTDGVRMANEFCDTVTHYQQRLNQNLSLPTQDDGLIKRTCLYDVAHQPEWTRMAVFNGLGTANENLVQTFLNFQVSDKVTKDLKGIVP
jgi:hypothetical protein